MRFMLEKSFQNRSEKGAIQTPAMRAEGEVGKAMDYRDTLNLPKT
jgi:hypothetical protein